MKLLCVNAKKVTTVRTNETGTRKFVHSGDGLVEGKIYETRAKSFIDNSASDGQECYYIDGLGIKLKCRFAELLDETNSDVKEESLEDQLEKAVANEDYVLATELREKLNK